ncbi:alpha/beta hydrolase [Leptobacterium flavescens]|uniref:alpha/beta hydrolase n=1 Tax=Leptobacterium flavescens TaxID=472055 RepID=UPI0021CE0153|nr:alpha/beta hydrolase [Leptobacterium flavescens]
MFGFQEKLLFKSDSLPVNYKFSFEEKYEELFLTSNDDSKLHGLHFKQNKPNGIILYFHGNARSLNYWGSWAEELSTRYNYDVIIWDYRGYGKSNGKREFEQMLDDGLLFYDYAKSKMSEDKIIVFGRSLGGAFATHVAKQNTVGGLILESTFTNIEEVINRKYWFLPTSVLLKYPFQSDKNIGSINTDTFILHGNKDDLIPYDMSKELFEASPAKNKKIYTVDGGGHNNLRGFEAYYQALDEIIKEQGMPQN